VGIGVVGSGAKWRNTTSRREEEAAEVVVAGEVEGKKRE
jgi:hypothetical protein